MENVLASGKNNGSTYVYCVGHFGCIIFMRLMLFSMRERVKRPFELSNKQNKKASDVEVNPKSWTKN